MTPSDADLEKLAAMLGLEALLRADPALFRQTAGRMGAGAKRHPPYLTKVPPTTEPAHVFVAAVRR